MLTGSEQSLVDARPNGIDFERVQSLHYLGHYVRRLPVNIARMMENAYDWEHLPYVHASSFSSIDLIDSGKWGWRAKIGLPDGASVGHQLIDLLVERGKNYWVSTVFSGPGKGFEIHTQATAITDQEIEVDVRFYLPAAPDDAATSEMILNHLSSQYATLYDEDLGLMSGRQNALDDRQRWDAAELTSDDIRVGLISDLDPNRVHVVETDAGRHCVRMWQDRWIVHSAVCPHLLGPLEDAAINAQGEITCPWHGYRFDVETGQNAENKCRALAPPPLLIEAGGALFLRSKP